VILVGRCDCSLMWGRFCSFSLPYSRKCDWCRSRSRVVVVALGYLDLGIVQVVACTRGYVVLRDSKICPKCKCEPRDCQVCSVLEPMQYGASSRSTNEQPNPHLEAVVHNNGVEKRHDTGPSMQKSRQSQRCLVFNSSHLSRTTICY
jgi:hypothetical protein